MTEYETVTVKASLDAQGNGAFPSDTNIITHDGIPLRDYLIAENEHTLKKPEGLNENGTIIVPENTDARTLKKDGVYYCYQWLPESVPENSHALAIRVVNSKNGSRALYADLTASPLVYRAFVSGEVFYDWKLIAGEVLLWSGSIETGTVPCAYDLSMFGSLKVIASNGAVILIEINNNNIYGVSGITYDNYTNLYYVYGTIDGKKLTIHRFKIQNPSSSTTALSQGTVAKIIGRP